MRVPRVPLNRGDHFKLLVMLSGGDVGSEIRLSGGIREGEVHPNRSATPDEKPPLFSRAARLITILLTASVLTLATIVVTRDDTRPPIGCATGSLTLTGSTAFAPVLAEVAKKYEGDCEGAAIEVDPHGSTAGVREFAAAGTKPGAKGSPPVVALSDGPKPSGLPQLRETRVAVSVFALVVNDDVRLTNLSTRDVRRLYRGEIRNWRAARRPRPARAPGQPGRQLRDATGVSASGTGTGRDRELIVSTASTRTTSTAPALRCELDSTDQVLTTVAGLPGAIGYSELNAATRSKGLHLLRLDGHTASVDALEHGTNPYPYREIEYAYTYGRPPADSLASSFLPTSPGATART